MNGTEVQKSSAIVKTAESAAIALTPETVLAYVNGKATKQEIALFLNQCAMFGLNPFKREIYLIKYSANEPATFVVGYEAYIKRADRTGKWAGMESGTEDDKDGRLVKAWAKIYRKDWDRPLYHEVFLNEYLQTKDEWVDNRKTGKKVPTRFWAEKPKTMLKKVAIEQGMRMAFPDEFAGMPYAAEEMPIDHAALPTAEVRPASKPSDYEASKLRPLPRVKDEFEDGPDLPDNTEPEAAEPKPRHEPDLDIVADAEVVDGEPGHEPPAMASLAAFGKAISELKALGISEDTIWSGIHRYTAETFKKAVVEVSDFTTAELDAVNGYLNRKLHATRADRAKKGKANG